MAGIEGIRAGRPLEQGPWLHKFESVAPEIVGEGALNFNDETIGTKEVDVLRPGAFIRLKYQIPEEDFIDGDELAGIAQAEAPQSFLHGLSLFTTGDVGIAFIADKYGDKKRVVTAGVRQKRVLVNEQRTLEDTVNEAYDVKLSWVNPNFRIKLATVETPKTIPGRDLKQLAHFLDEKVRLRPGFIIPINLGTGTREAGTPTPPNNSVGLA